MSQADNTAVSEPAAPQDAAPIESAPVETKAPEVAEPTPFAKALSGEDSPTKVETDSEAKPADSTEEAPPKPADETPTEEQPQTKAEERKSQLNTEIRDLVTQRNSIRQEVEKLNSETYKTPSEEDLLGQVNPETGEYFNPLEAKVAAMEQRQQLDSYNSKVAEAQLTIESESGRVMQDFPLFDSNSPEFNAELSHQAAKLMQANLVLDQNTGQVIGSNVSPYELYSTLAAAAQSSRVQGEIKGQRATEQMLANADTTPSNAPVKPKEDPFLAGFNSKD